MIDRPARIEITGCTAAVIMVLAVMVLVACTIGGHTGAWNEGYRFADQAPGVVYIKPDIAPGFCRRASEHQFGLVDNDFIAGCTTRIKEMWGTTSISTPPS